MEMITFFVLSWKDIFGQMWYKKSKLFYKAKVGTKTNLNTQEPMVMLTFSVLDWKYSFLTNLGQNLMIAC